MGMGLNFRLRVNGAPVWTDPQSPFVQKLLNIVKQPTSFTKRSSTDGIMLGELRNLAVLGPGDSAQAHRNDEWIALDQLSLGSDVYCRLIDELCCRF